LLSVVVDDFLERYDPENKAMLTKLRATLPILVELVGDKSINQILQADLNSFFDEVQKLPVRSDGQKFKGMSYSNMKKWKNTHRIKIPRIIVGCL
jgi:hypothetical protein